MANAMAGGVPKVAQDLFEKGEAAAERKNYDYAITLFLEALKIAPNFFVARRVLREIEIEKFESKKLPAFLRQFFSTIFHIHHYIAAFFNVSFGKLEKVLKNYEKILKSNPTSAFAYIRHARAALGLDMIETAVQSMEYARKLKPANMRIVREMGYLYKENGNIDEAKGCFQLILDKNKDDRGASKALHDLAAMGTIIRGQWEDTSTYRTSVKDIEFSEKAEKEVRLQKSRDDTLSLIEDYEKKLQREPENINFIKQLANLYIDQKEYDKAVELFQKAIDLNPADTDLPMMQYRIVIKKYDYEIQKAEEEVAKDPTNEELQQKVAKLKEGKTEYMLEDLRKRVAKYPSDLSLRFELGYVYMEQGHLDEAIKEFQHAKSSAKLRARSLNHIGECFRRKGYYDLAIDQFKASLNELYIMDSFKKEVLYNLGRAYEEQGRKREALEQYKIIFGEDIGFKDISKRVDALYQELKAAGGEEIKK